MFRKFVLVVAPLIAVAFMVVPSLSRLAFLIESPRPESPTDGAFLEHRLTGFIHIVAGLLMLVLMPLLLSGRVRKNWPGLHRWAGRIFVVIALCVSLSALVMNRLFPVVGGLLKVTVIDVMCVAQMGTLVVALRAIWRRDVATHRRWMLRAIGVTFAAGTAGIFVVPFYALDAMNDVVVGTGRWLGLVLSVGTVELLLRRSVRATPPAASANETLAFKTQ